MKRGRSEVSDSFEKVLNKLMADAMEISKILEITAGCGCGCGCACGATPASVPGSPDPSPNPTSAVLGGRVTIMSN